MTRGQAWALHVSTLLVAGTGLVYAWMLYLLEPADEFSILNHPQQALVQHAHVWTAPLMVFALGMIWRSHVWHSLRSGRRTARRTGLLQAGCLVPMVASGYFLQTSVSERWRAVWTWVHVVSSGVFVCGYLVHQCLSLYASRSEAGGGRRLNTGGGRRVQTGEQSDPGGDRPSFRARRRPPVAPAIATDPSAADPSAVPPPPAGRR